MSAAAPIQTVGVLEARITSIAIDTPTIDASEGRQAIENFGRCGRIREILKSDSQQGSRLGHVPREGFLEETYRPCPA